MSVLMVQRLKVGYALIFLHWWLEGPIFNVLMFRRFYVILNVLLMVGRVLYSLYWRSEEGCVSCVYFVSSPLRDNERREGLEELTLTTLALTAWPSLNSFSGCLAP